ncbi:MULTISPECIES: GntR family transcriptional regulator [Pseudophaeobacter]|uniref:GntR family transcriptional regulator n=1 Tax=Pseudophaeobacter TaxID=1541822 RepID=UPI00242A4B6F|nr:FCD domain-containing protein [Pseudophaeobacter profundi]
MTEATSLASDLDLLRGTSIASLVRAKIEDEIISGQRQGGDHVTEQELTSKFGISRGPVREALRALEGQGLLEQKKNKGWFVKVLNQHEVACVFEMRAILDNGLAALLVSKRTSRSWEEGLKSLKRQVSDMDEAIRSNDTASYAKNNQAFHDTLLGMAGNDHLARTYRNLMGQLASHVANSLTLDDAMKISNAEHVDMIDAISEADERRLRQIFASHRVETLNRMTQVSNQSGES